MQDDTAKSQTAVAETLTIVIPALNEEDAIGDTISLPRTVRPGIVTTYPSFGRSSP